MLLVIGGVDHGLLQGHILANIDVTWLLCDFAYVFILLLDNAAEGHPSWIGAIGGETAKSIKLWLLGIYCLLTDFFCLFLLVLLWMWCHLLVAWQSRLSQLLISVDLANPAEDLGQVDAATWLLPLSLLFVFFLIISWRWKQVACSRHFLAVKLLTTILIFVIHISRTIILNLKFKL